MPENEISNSFKVFYFIINFFYTKINGPNDSTGFDGSSVYWSIV